MSISELVPQIEVRAFGARRRESDGFAVDRPNGFHETIWVRLHDHMQLRIGTTAFTVQPVFGETLQTIVHQDLGGL